MSGGNNPALNNLGNRVVTRSVTALDLVIRAWGAEWNAPDHNVYQFTGRDYDSTDMNQSGIYATDQLPELLYDLGPHPDMPADLLAEDGTVIALDTLP